MCVRACVRACVCDASTLPYQGQEEVMDLLQAAPFQNMYPRPFVKGLWCNFV